MQQDMDDMKADIEEIKKSLVEIRAVLSEAKGGWKKHLCGQQVQVVL